MVKFEKGKSWNPKGRPKSETKNNEQRRRMIRDFVSGIISTEEMTNDFDKIEKPELKFKIRLDFLKMLLPDPIRLQILSPEEMEELFTYI
jgi:hypothetical protein